MTNYTSQQWVQALGDLRRQTEKDIHHCGSLTMMPYTQLAEAAEQIIADDFPSKESQKLVSINFVAALSMVRSKDVQPGRRDHSSDIVIDCVLQEHPEVVEEGKALAREIVGYTPRMERKVQPVKSQVKMPQTERLEILEGLKTLCDNIDAWVPTPEGPSEKSQLRFISNPVLPGTQDLPMVAIDAVKKAMHHMEIYCYASTITPGVSMVLVAQNKDLKKLSVSTLEEYRAELEQGRAGPGRS